MGWRGFRYSDEKPEINLEDPYADPIALMKYREYEVRRKQIDIEKAKLLREKVRLCYLNEGVNHYKNCREEVANYKASIKGIGINVANAGKNDLGRAEVKAQKLEES